MPYAIGLPAAVADVPVVAFSLSPIADTSMSPDRPLSQAIRRLSLIGVHRLPYIVKRARRTVRHVPKPVPQPVDAEGASPSSTVDVTHPTERSSSVAAIDDVRIVPMATHSVTVGGGLAPLQNALGRCVNPFASLAKDVQQIYAIATEQPLSETTSIYIDLFGQIVDTLSGVEPRIAMARSLCRASERAIDIIHGGKPDAGDITDMVETWRAAGARKTQTPQTVPKRKKITAAHVHARPRPASRADAHPPIDVNQSADLLWLERDMTSIVERDSEEVPDVEGSGRRVRADLPANVASPCLTEMGAELALYQTVTDDVPFLNDRPALKDAIVRSRAYLTARYFHQATDDAESSKALIHSSMEKDAAASIDTLRQAVRRQWATLVGWEQLSVRQKQQLGARMTADVFRDLQKARNVADGAAYCPWMLDLMSAEMERRLRSGRHLLQISFIADRENGPIHSVLLYADDPVVFKHFGQLDAPRGDRRKVNPMAHSVFIRFLCDYRNHVTIIDPVGPRLVSDFTQQRGLLGAELVLEDVLRAADFDVGPNAAYRVLATIPARER